MRNTSILSLILPYKALRGPFGTFSPGLASLLLFSTSGHASDCKLALLFPQSLGTEFKQIAKNPRGEGGKKLDSLLEDLGLQASKDEDPTLILKALLSGLNNSPSSIELFYPKSIEQHQQIFFALESRLRTLESFLEKNPLHEDLKLYDSLLAALLFDLKPNGSFPPNFDKVSAATLIQKLTATKDKHYSSLESEEVDHVAAWEAAKDAKANEVPLAAPELEQVPDEKIVILESEDEVKVRNAMSKMRLSDFLFSQRKEPIESISQLEELQRYGFFLIHGGSPREELLISSQERGIEFLVELSQNTKLQDRSLNAAPVLRSFLINLRRSLDGTLEQRYGRDFTEKAADHFTRALASFRGNLNLCEYFHRMIQEDYVIQEELNIIFEIVGIPEFHPSEF